MQKRFLPVLPLAVVLLTSCASVTATKTSRDDFTISGIRYYLPRPYILVTSSTTMVEKAATSVVRYEIIWLPDYSQQYAISVNSGLGKTTTNLTFENGWQFNKLDSTTDTTTVTDSIKALITEVSNLLTTNKGLSNSNVLDGLYRINFNENGEMKGLSLISNFRYASIPVERLNVKEIKQIKIQETIDLITSKYPENGNDEYWCCDSPNILYIDAISGSMTGLAIGSTAVKAISSSGNTLATFTIEVVQ